MRKMLVGLILVLAAVLLPTAASTAQTTATFECRRGVLVQGRCISVDRQATVCDGDACVEFVEESTSICPASAVTVGTDPTVCAVTEPALQRDPACPEGARGTVGDCFIYVAIGPAGCPSPSAPDGTGNCRREVADANGSFYCERETAQLIGRDCTGSIDPMVSTCPAGTTRFDSACWRLNGLASPESCDGHAVVGTIELASGQCQVPADIPIGPSTCVDGSIYREDPIFVLINETGERQGQGPLMAGCIDNSASVGISVRYCFFTDDEFDWGDWGDPEGCTRFEDPTLFACPDGFSIDDSLGGLCGRFAEEVNGACPAESRQNGPWCVFEAEFTVFDCPAGTQRYKTSPVCAAHRDRQSAVACGQDTMLSDNPDAEFGLALGCFPLVGPQPGVCNGVGTIDSCFDILEPTTTTCLAAAGCVALEELIVIETTTCQGRAITVDLNLTPPQEPTEGDDVILGTPLADTIDALGGDDIVCSLGGDDIVHGGLGDDLLRGGTGDDTLNGDEGSDRLFGVSGNDTLNGGDGVDTLHGNRGEDILDGGNDDDRLFGYADDDILNGGAGNDKIFGHFGNDTIDGGEGDDRLFGWGNEDTIIGGPGNDLISGNFGNDMIDAGPGDDTVYGADGDDTISGGDGNDILNGNSLHDTINGGAGDDAIDGGIGTDVCNGDTGTDTALRCETVDSIP